MTNETELERELTLKTQLQTLGSILHALEKTELNAGKAALTHQRIIDIVAGHIVTDEDAMVKVCPGYGTTHCWSTTRQRLSPSELDLLLRCDAHRERRLRERRK